MANFPQYKVNPATILAPQILYCGEHDHIDVAQDYLFIENEVRQTTKDYKLANIAGIVCFGGTEISTKARSRLMREGVNITFLDKYGAFLGRQIPGVASEQAALVKLQQSMTEDQRLHLTRRMVLGVLRMIRGKITRWGNARGRDVSNERREMDYLLNAATRRRDITVDGLRGMVGAGFRLYWQSFYDMGIIYAGLGADSDSVDDECPINDMLAFVKSLLEISLYQAIASVGLDASIGIFHTTYRNQLGLVADLALELFHLPHSIISQAVNCQLLVAKDFDDWQPGKLPPVAIAKLTEKWQAKLAKKFTYPGATQRTTFGQAMVIQPLQIAQYLKGEIEGYAPLILR